MCPKVHILSLSFVLTFYAICHRIIYADGVPIQRSHLFLNIIPERISPTGVHSIVWFYLSCYPGDFQNCHREKINKILFFCKTALSVKAIFDIVIVKKVSLYGFTERTKYMGTEELKQAPETVEPEAQTPAIQHEDVALKTAFRYFADVLLPYFGIKGKAVDIAATELVHVKVFHEDFNFDMEDGSCAHFEFQSTNEGLEGLKRFRAYEAVYSYQHKVPVTTYVLFSGKIQKPMSEFTEGVNTYRIVPIIMQSRNADQVIRELQEKQESGGELTKEDLVPLTLCLLMGGEMPQKDRVEEAYRITRNAGSVGQEELDKIEAVLYIMADKFLESAEMDELTEVIGMTELGQKLVNRGISQGFEQGKLKIAQNLIGTLDEETIAEKTELPLKTVLELKKKAESIPVA